MSQSFYPANRNLLVRSANVNLNVAGDVVIFTPPTPDIRLNFVAAFVENISVKGTLTVAPVILLDNGTDGHNVSASKTLTSGATNQAFVLAAATQPYTVTDGGTIRLKKSTLGVGQATTFRERTDNIAKLTTAAVHGFSVGDKITNASVGGTGYNGEVVVLSVPTTTTYTFASVGDDEASTADTAGRVGAYLATITAIFA